MGEAMIRHSDSEPLELVLSSELLELSMKWNRPKSAESKLGEGVSVPVHVRTWKVPCRDPYLDLGTRTDR